MAFNFTGTDEDLQKEAGTFKIIPPNTRVTAIITEVEEKSNKNNDGEIANITFQIRGGAFDGVNIWERFNFNSSVGKNYSVSERQLGRICVITLGKPGYRHIAELRDKKIDLITDTEPYTDKEGVERIKNIAKNYHPVGIDFKDIAAGKKSAPAVKIDDDFDTIPF